MKDSRRRSLVFQQAPSADVIWICKQLTSPSGGPPMGTGHFLAMQPRLNEGCEFVPDCMQALMELLHSFDTPTSPKCHRSLFGLVVESFVFTPLCLAQSSALLLC